VPQKTKKRIMGRIIDVCVLKKFLYLTAVAIKEIKNNKADSPAKIVPNKPVIELYDIRVMKMI